VGESFGDPEELEGVIGGLCLEVESCPFAKIGGIAAEVDCDIPDMAGKDADELTLRLTQLVVEPTEHAFDGKGLIVLNELRGKASGRKG